MTSSDESANDIIQMIRQRLNEMDQLTQAIRENPTTSTVLKDTTSPTKHPDMDVSPDIHEQLIAKLSQEISQTAISSRKSSKSGCFNPESSNILNSNSQFTEIK